MNVFILAGGKGSRLYPLTKYTPKPLIKYKKKEILKHIINHLKKFSVKEVNVLVGSNFAKYKKFQIKENIRNKIHINIIKTGANSDILKRILLIKNKVTSNFLLLYGDTIANVNLNSLLNFHNKNKKKITLSVIPYKSDFGLISLDKKNNIISFKEKPFSKYFINIGFFLFEKKHLNFLSKYSNFESALENLVKFNKIKSYIHKGNFHTINNYRDLNT
jgi:NDP-sugar pyrophosphorylase family protein